MILLRPVAIFPGSQTVIHDEFWHVVPATPAGSGSKDGHNSQPAEALTPTGNPQSPLLVFAKLRFQKYFNKKTQPEVKEFENSHKVKASL